MKICAKCQNEFPTTAVINGKRRNLSARRFCFKCSPFGTHNTQDLTSPNVTFEKDGRKWKRCPACKEVLELNTNNYYIRKTQVGFHYYCKKCQDAKTKERQKQIKTDAIAYKGGKCIICGYSKYIGALEFHHLDPRKKDFQISCHTTYNFEILKKELEKCCLVCSNCHKEIHAGIHQSPAGFSSEDACI